MSDIQHQLKVKVPELKDLKKDILPQEEVLMMGVGPTMIPSQVAEANGIVINHLGETMAKAIISLQEMARYVFQTKSEKVIGVSGPSSAAIEMGIANLVWTGRKVLVLKNGSFSARLGIMAERCGGDVKVLEPEGVSDIKAEDVEAELKQTHYDLVTIVQGETSTGVWNKDIPEIGKLCKEHGALFMVDTVSTLSTIPFLMDEWNIDVAITGGQKGLSSIPGVSICVFNDKSWEIIENRTTPIAHWCLDAKLAWKFWGEHSYHYTAPTSGILALREALKIICEETLEKRWERHERCSKALQAGLETAGIKLFTPKEFRMISVVAVEIPEHIEPKDVLKKMEKDHNVQIAGAFGGLNIVRIGQLGEQCSQDKILRTLRALVMTLRDLGMELDLEAGVDALNRAI